MSKTVDERVVSMQFDNKNFERNVSTSMSTLDKLKQKLNLTGAAKGLENINTSANKVNMSGLANGVETVNAKFSALQVMGVTALANITNSAVNAGKRIVSALTIEPVKDGFQEYEMTLNAIQTTMAGTGLTAQEVQDELKKLDEYADKTVYSTADMLNNLPKFTNAGVELKDATKAMIGISNATALAGGDAGKASIAFYNLGQAIGTGYLTRMDYNSINNAGIATMEWKNQMVEAAIAQGTLTRVGEDAYKAGNKTLTLQQLFIDGLQEQWATTDVMMKVFGDYGDETTEIGKKSYAAAQDIKTFSMMMDSLKATAGTGWKDTWELIFGDLDDAKVLWTGLANFISNILNKMSDFRNAIIESALYRGFSDIGERIKALLNPVKKSVDAIKDVTDSLKDYSVIVDEIIAGKWGNAPTRWQDLTAAGYDWAHAQNLVNERLGCSVRHATNFVEKQKEQVQSTDELTESDTKLIKELFKLSDAELKAMGYSDDWIKQLRNLQNEIDSIAKKLGLTTDEFLDNIDQINGRWLIINGFKNIGNMLVGIGKSIKDAWTDIFPEATIENIADAIFDAIAAFHRFTRGLRLVEGEENKLNENGEKLKRTFKGIFAVLDIVTTLIGGPLKIAFKIISQLLDAFGFNILDVTAFIGDALVGLRDWMDSILDFSGIFEKIAPYIKSAIDAVKGWIDAVKPMEKIGAFFVGMSDGIKKWASESELIKKISGFFKSSFESIKQWIEGLRSAENIPQYIIEGLVNGLGSGVKAVGEAIWNLGKTIILKICEVLGIHSPSTEFFEIGRNIIAGLVNGLKSGASAVWNTIKGIGSKCVELIRNIDFGAILAAGVSVGIVMATNKIGDALTSLAAPFEGIGDFLTDFGKGVKKALKGLGNYLNSKAILSFAIAIAVLAASVIALSFIDTDKLLNSILVIGALAGIISLLSIAISKLGPMQGMEVGKFALVVLGVSGSLLLVATALKKLSGLNLNDMLIAGTAIIALSGIIVGLIAATKLFNSTGAKMVGTFLAMSVVMLILTHIAKQISKLDNDALIKGGIGIIALAGIIVGLMAATKLFKAGGNVGSSMLGIAAAMLLMIFVIKAVARIDTGELARGLVAITLFGGIITGLIAATRYASKGKNVGKIGTAILGISIAMLMLASVVKTLGKMDTSTLIKGTVAVAALGGIITGLIAATKLAGNDNLIKIGFTLLTMSIAMAILAGIAVVLGFVHIDHLAKGVIAVGLLSGMMALLITATKHAKDCKSNLVVMTVAIGLMAAAIAALSFIDPVALVTATASLSAVMGMFALLIFVMQYIKTGSKTWKRNLAALSVLTLIVLALAGVILLLSSLSPGSALDSAGSLSILLLSLSASLVIVSKVGKLAKNALIGVGALTVMAIPLLAFVGVLALMQNIQSATTNALLLAALATTMTLLLIPLTLIGSLWMPALIGVGALTLMAVPLLAFVGVLALMQNIQNATENATLLIKLATVMTTVLIALSIVGPLALVGVATLSALSILMIALGILAVGIGALMEKFPAIQNFLDTGIPVLIQLAGGIGKMIGAFVGGIMTEIASTLPTIGQCLSDFMKNAQGFIDGAKTVDDSVLKGAAVLVGAILALTVADLINGLVSFLPFSSSFAQMGTDLSTFMANAQGFIDGAKLVTPEIMAGVKTLAETILILTAANVIEGLTSWMTGGSSLTQFGSQLGELGTNMSTFANNLGAFDASKVTSVTCAANAIKALANAASTIPNEGGLWAAIVGENSLATFGSYLPNLGANMAGFVTNLGTFEASQANTVSCAAEAITKLAEAASNIPNEGGLWAAIVGENSLATFSGYLPGLGSNMASFVSNLGTFDKEQVTTVGCAAEAITKLAEAASTIPNEGGLWAAIVGDNSLATFSGYLPNLGANMAGFVTNLGTFTEAQVATVTCAANAIKSLAEATSNIPNEGGLWAKLAGDNSLATFGDKLPGLGEDIAGFADKAGNIDVSKVNAAIRTLNSMIELAKLDVKDAGSHMDEFGNKLKKFADKMADFTKKIANVGSESVISAINKTKRLISLAQTVANTNVESLNTFGDSLKTFAKNGVDGFVKAFTDSEPKKKVEDAAKELLDKFIDGLESKQKNVNKKIEDVASDALKKLGTNSQYKDAKKAGSHLVDGFAAGINGNNSAKSAAKSMAEKAVQAAKDALKINSPSKVFKKIGSGVPEGFAMGISMFGSSIKGAISDMASGAIDKAKDSISLIADVINSDIDAEPVIRPVLDLSDVESGAGTINGMFANRTLSVNTRAIGAISASMSKLQNGDNSSELLSTMKGLRKDIATMPRNTYTVNGITYDDGSNITNAVESLVRAARIERRT